MYIHSYTLLTANLRVFSSPQEEMPHPITSHPTSSPRSPAAVSETADISATADLPIWDILLRKAYEIVGGLCLVSSI